MRHDTAIPVRLGWSSPFVRWQGRLASVSSIDLAAQVTRDALAGRDLPATEVSTVVHGWTVPQPEIFYGAPTLAHRIGAGHTSGPMVSQACATGAASVELASLRVAQGLDELTLVVTHRPMLSWPRPEAPGGAPATEHWVLDNFARDPVGGMAMLGTAEGVAAQAGMTREQLDEVTLLRYEQYQTALAEDCAFQRRYMIPALVPSKKGDPTIVEADEGIVPTTVEGLAKLSPVTPDGVVTFGSQTHPADGAAGLVVTRVDQARDLADGQGIARILGTGQCRVGVAEMPKAPVPAARAALDAAGLDFDDLDAVTTHNPFAVNDVWFAEQTGLDLDRMNVHGCSLVFGHPQGPTGTRLIIELIHTLAERGGGTGLFTGCAAGDTGAALVLRVEA